MISYKDYKIESLRGGEFRMYTPGETLVIIFIAEWRDGLYSKIKWIYKNNKQYNAARYHLKYISEVNNAAFVLLVNGCLWDYKKQRPALEGYNEAMFQEVDYIRSKIINNKKAMSIYQDLKNKNNGDQLYGWMFQDDAVLYETLQDLDLYELKYQKDVIIQYRDLLESILKKCYKEGVI